MHMLMNSLAKRAVEKQPLNDIQGKTKSVTLLSSEEKRFIDLISMVKEVWMNNNYSTLPAMIHIAAYLTVGHEIMVIDAYH